MPSVHKRKVIAKTKQAPSINPPPECVSISPASVFSPSPPPVVFKWKMEVLYNDKKMLNKQNTHINFTFIILQSDATFTALNEVIQQNKNFHSDQSLMIYMHQSSSHTDSCNL